jgi:arylsulfatase
MNPIVSCSAALAAVAACFPSQGAPKPKPVNFVVIYLDDVGYGDITLTGATGYRTPNIDKMAKKGAFFSHYYSPQAVCSASRVGLLSGCYPNRVGISGALGPNSKVGLNPAEETIAEVLKKRNYKTGAIGKWHLGDSKEFLPLQQGFDEYLGLPYSNDMWPVKYDGTPKEKNGRKVDYPPLFLIEGNERIREMKTLEDQSELTTIYTERAVRFITQNKNNPFFLYLAHSMAHVPLAVSGKFKGKSQQGMYGDVMMEIDWSVGQVMQTLEKLKLDDNTLVIFTSDNGPWINFGNHAGNTGGLREGKGTSFEGGQRVPCLMYWKGVIPEGVVCNKLISGIDILPTLAEIAGAPLPERKIDGVSILELMKGNMDANPRKYFLYYYRKNSLEAVSNGSWKLVFPHPGRTYEGFEPGKDGNPGKVNENNSFPKGLYDLRRDAGERYNVLEFHPNIVAELEKIATDAREDLGDDLTGNPGKNRREPGRVEK